MVDNKNKSLGSQVCDFIILGINWISLICIIMLVYVFIVSFIDVFIYNKIPQQVCCCEMTELYDFYHNYDKKMNKVISPYNSERMPFCMHYINNTKKVQFQESNIIHNTTLVGKDGKYFYLPESQGYKGLIELNLVVRNITKKNNFDRFKQKRLYNITRTLRKIFFPFNYCEKISDDSMLSLSYINTYCNIFTQDLD